MSPCSLAYLQIRISSMAGGTPSSPLAPPTPHLPPSSTHQAHPSRPLLQPLHVPCLSCILSSPLPPSWLCQPSLAHEAALDQEVWLRAMLRGSPRPSLLLPLTMRACPHTADQGRGACGHARQASGGDLPCCHQQVWKGRGEGEGGGGVILGCIGGVG